MLWRRFWIFSSTWCCWSTLLFGNQMYSAKTIYRFPRNWKLKNDDDQFKDGIIIQALMFIFMYKKHLVIDEPGAPKEVHMIIWEVLETWKRTFFNIWFGHGRKCLFITAGWFTRKAKDEGTNNEEIHYDWGPRAELGC